MPRDVVIIPAKGIKTGKTRLSTSWNDYAREALNLEQLHQTLCAAASVYGKHSTYVVSACTRVEGVARREGVQFILELGALGLNGALDGARTSIDQRDLNSISVLPVDLPFLNEELLKGLNSQYPSDTAVLVPDRLGDGTNFMRFPAHCKLPFNYGVSSFSKHLALLKSMGITCFINCQTSLRDDFDEAWQIGLHRKYRPFLQL